MSKGRKTTTFTTSGKMSNGKSSNEKMSIDQNVEALNDKWKRYKCRKTETSNGKILNEKNVISNGHMEKGRMTKYRIS